MEKLANDDASNLLSLQDSKFDDYMATPVRKSENASPIESQKKI